jgi:hypothetical protein
MLDSNKKTKGKEEKKMKPKLVRLSVMAMLAVSVFVTPAAAAVPDEIRKIAATLLADVPFPKPIPVVSPRGTLPNPLPQPPAGPRGTLPNPLPKPVTPAR